VWPTVHVQEAWRDGLDVIALTEHAEYQPHAQDVNTDLLRSYQIAKPTADQLGIVLIPGMEITKPDPLKAPPVLPDGSAHFNALFLTDPNKIRTPDLMEALRLARAQGAFVFWNHPRFRVPRGRWFPAIARAHEEQLFQGMELVNGPDFYDEAFPWIAERQLTILANSDAHDPVPPRAAGTPRPITLIFARSRDVAGVRDALLNRRTAAWLADDVWGAEDHLRALWTAAITLESPIVARRPSPVIGMRNASAIPMRIVLVDPSRAGRARGREPDPAAAIGDALGAAGRVGNRADLRSLESSHRARPESPGRPANDLAEPVRRSTAPDLSSRRPHG
jgi:hypothetical protein